MAKTQDSTPELSDVLAPPADSAGVSARPARLSGRSVAPLIIALAIAGIGAFVIASSTTGGAGMFNYPLAEVVARADELQGKEVKLSGRIVVGSVRGEPASEAFRFDLEDAGGQKIAIAYTKLLPDPFEEGREAIVQGRLEGRTIFASTLTVKCPSRYADTESMTEAERQRYVETDYRKHTELARQRALQGGGQGAPGAPAAAPAAPGAAPTAPPSPGAPTAAPAAPAPTAPAAQPN